MKRALILALALSSCSSPAPPKPTPTPSPTISSAIPTPSPSPKPVAFDAARVVRTTRDLVAIGNREDTSPGFKSAVAYVTKKFEALGYTVSHQNIAIPAGTSAGHAVPAGYTTNTVAAPPGFDPSKPHLLVGGHLDTVAGTVGANDNASGSAMVLELARLARLSEPAMPIVWVEWGGEERRHKGTSGALFGSRYYLSHLTNRDALRGVLAVDMVGYGPYVHVCHGGKTPRSFVDALLSAAQRIGVPAQEQVVTTFFSDHQPFENAGFTVGWLYAGDHPAVHTPRDTMSVIQTAQVDRIGRVAWETLRTLRL